MPGTAHFCEHLLFMVRAIFQPKAIILCSSREQNSFPVRMITAKWVVQSVSLMSNLTNLQYIASHGGRTNAYTAASDTNYYFSVGADHLAGALERFSGFFHSPLFAQSCTARELQAVDSEHKKNLQADSWRLFQMSKSLSKPGHPWAKFGSGNLVSLTAAARSTAILQRASDTSTNGVDSLTASSNVTPFTSRVPSPVPSFASEKDADGGSVGRETRRRLIEWWESNYCSSRMNLVIIGKGVFISSVTTALRTYHRVA
jgi:insulysin